MENKIIWEITDKEEILELTKDQFSEEDKKIFLESGIDINNPIRIGRMEWKS